MDITAFDLSVLHFIEDNLQTPVLTYFFMFFTALFEAGAFWILTAFIMFLIKKTRKGGLLLGLGLLLTLIIVNFLIKNAVQRPRPFTIDSFNLLIAVPPEFSFPSGHTSSSFCSAFLLTYVNKKNAFWAYPLATLVALSRLYFTVHFPTDVIFGAIFGTLTGIISVIIFRLVEKKTSLFEKEFFRK